MATLNGARIALTNTMHNHEGKLPTPLMTSEPGSFARFTVLERLPRIAQQVIDDNDYPPEIAKTLQALQEELVSGRLRGLREQAADAAFWNREVQRREGRTWLEIEWYTAEAYFYRRILEATRYFDPGPWEGQDPFQGRKRQQEKLSIQLLAQSWPRLAEMSAEQTFDTLLHGSLWANRADLSYEAVAAHARGGLEFEKERHLLLIDDTDRARPLLARGLGRADLIADNIGMELLCDLALCDFLLGQGWVREVVFHLKDRPFFVSDAMVCDVLTLVAQLVSSPDVSMRQLGTRLHRHVTHQRIALRDDSDVRELGQPFWTSPHEFRQMPPELQVELQNADLIILKGDANYRRLLGDRHWPPTTRLVDATDHFPRPFLTLRTLKAEVIVGLEPGQAEMLTAEDPAWKINGKRALIQLEEERL